ncbi:transporter substrate-binding domain-containing protein, partial [Fusobacterium mortiferum]|uniref:transporter substrate-binding domain-containing protein n=1 Tax=Fusobacterium mortiferum TaxID=850 RepID=UPI001957A5BE|nr:transporter substrate-binding domain-containing protein [Fusobacterium mortiferum]
TLFGTENKIYKIGTDTNFPPFEFRNEDGKLIGVDMDLLEAIAEDQKFEYKIYELGFKQSLNALETGKLDAVMASVNITEERKLKYDFSDPYFKTGTALAVEKNTNLNSYDGLKGKFITVKRNTLSSKVAEDLAKKYKFYIMYL